MAADPSTLQKPFVKIKLFHRGKQGKGPDAAQHRCLAQGITDITGLMVEKPGGPQKLLQGHKINTGQTMPTILPNERPPVLRTGGVVPSGYCLHPYYKHCS